VNVNNRLHIFACWTWIRCLNLVITSQF